MTNVAHALAGLALILSFALLGQQRPRPMLWLCAVQSMAVAAVVMLQRDLWFALFALVALALVGLLLLFVLFRGFGDEPIARAGLAVWAGGVILAAVSIASAMQVAADGGVELLGCAFAVLLLGLLHSARSPTGLFSAQNGLILLTAAVPNVAPPALVAVALPIVPLASALVSRQAAMADVMPSRPGAMFTAALTTLVFLLACGIAVRPAFRVWLLNVGPPSLYLVLLVSFVAMFTASIDLYAAQGPRLQHASFLLLTAAVVLALLSDEPALTWLVLALAMLASAARARLNPVTFAPLAVAMLLALAGTLLLYGAAGNAALSWSGLPIGNGRALNLAGIFLLLGYGGLAAQAVFPKVGERYLLVTVPLLIMLRLHQFGLAAELLLALGLTTLVVAVVGLRRVEMAASCAVMAVLGLIVFAIGLGASNAALLLIALLVLVAMATRASVLMPLAAAAVWTQRLAGLFLAALPLLALYLLADASAARSIWLLPPLALGAIAASTMNVR